MELTILIIRHAEKPGQILARPRLDAGRLGRQDL